MGRRVAVFCNRKPLECPANAKRCWRGHYMIRWMRSWRRRGEGRAICCQALNNSRDEEEALRAQILQELFGSAGESPWIQPPFFCDYGTNITLGDKVFFNFNCVVLDVAAVRIGNHTMFGPNVQIYTATHPMDAAERRRGLEFAKPISIGDDVWVGGSAVICPGVTIGSRSIIGAGSVVTRDVPGGCVCGGESVQGDKVSIGWEGERRAESPARPERGIRGSSGGEGDATQRGPPPCFAPKLQSGVHCT